MIDICKRLYSSFNDRKIYVNIPNDGLHPSSASIELPSGRKIGGCHRKFYYQWKGFEPSNDKNPEYVLSAEMGNWLHRGIQDYLRKNTISTNLVVLSAEQTFYDKTNYTIGTSDLFLMDIETKELFGVDIKTVGEFAGKQCIENPSAEALMQCAIYLDAYQNTSRKGYRSVDYWVILYVSRDENWDLKAYKHGSMFKLMWQFWMKFENGYVVVYDQRGNKTEYPDITMEAIRKRNEKILKEIKKDKLPDRDYEIQYSEEYIMALYKTDNIKFKKDIAVVEKWLKKGAKQGELDLELGDKECAFCAYSELCYSNNPAAGKVKTDILFNIDEINNSTAVSKNIML